MTAVAMSTTLGQLARQEIRNYLSSKLFWVGFGLATLIVAQTTFLPDAQSKLLGRTFISGLPIAAGIGVFGINVMAGLTRRSDQLAAMSGSAAVSQRTRTLALACAVVVPAVAAFLLWTVSVAGDLAWPAEVPRAWDGVGDGFVYSTAFGQGVLGSIGGPLLGLVAARWVYFRGMAPLLSVLVVVATVLLQGWLEFTRSWHEVWIWINFYGPYGDGDDNNYLFTGSPYFWDLYLMALCALGVLAAIYRDPETDRRRVAKQFAVVAALAAVMLAASILGGLDHTIIHDNLSS